VIGGVSYDTIVQLSELPSPISQTIFSSQTYDMIGSTGSGKAIALKKLGFDVKLQGVIGQDEYGKKLRIRFENEQIPFLYEIDKSKTERHLNLMDNQGKRISIFLSNISFEQEFDYNQLSPFIQEADYVILNIINYCRNYIPIIRKLHKDIWCDLHDYDGKNPYYQDFIDAADYIFFSSDLVEDYKPIMSSWILKGKKLVICTHGNKGASCLTNNDIWYEEPINSSFQLVDSNGAGDNFFAGFL